MTEAGGASFDAIAERYASLAEAIEGQVRRRIVGQHEVVRDTLISLICGGHVLLEGVPGLGKTELMKSLAASVDLSFSRIQFTPDLMPADVLGTQVLQTDSEGHRSFEFREGPVFANLVLADEINRATPKSQSALLEAMQERQVTVAGATRPLPPPFMVLATQNPLEMEGTYPLPEAQLDRFLLKVLVPSPGPALLTEILRRTTGEEPDEVEAVCSAKHIVWMGRMTRRVPIASHLVEFVAMLVTATHPDGESAPDVVRHYVRAGASPRGGQAIITTAKARALLAGRPHVATSDIIESVHAALRHRLVLGYEAAADGVAADEIVRDVIEAAPQPWSGRSA